MRVLVTGGTGVVGRATVTALVQRGHVVSLLSRHARSDARQWTQGVHPIVGNVSDASTLGGAADNCEAVLHLTAIVDEAGADTFERVNVEGTRHVAREAERAGVTKLVYVSSLGAAEGQSPYHRSKRKAEAIVRELSGAWTVIRPGNVYGPGDEQISLLLRMIRTLPAIPVIGAGGQRFQPIWHDDLAEVLARAVERDDLAGRVLDVAGGDVTSQNDLIHRLSRITGREVARVEVPELVAKLGLRVATAVGMDVGFNENQMKMLTEGNEIAPGRENALYTVFGLTPTPLDTALTILAEQQEELLPEEGIGGLRRRRIWADITGSGMPPEQLMERIRANFANLMASFVETRAEHVGGSMVEEGATLTLALPLRGHVQVRVAECEPRVFTLVTLVGHPMAGAVRFLTETRGSQLRFEIQVFERAANVADLVMMRTLGERLQEASWREMVDNVVKASGGTSSEVRQEIETLDEEQAERIEEWLRDLVLERKREEAGI